MILSNLFGVSIHAPAWGATGKGRCRGGGFKFQFTLPRGERPERLGRVPRVNGVSIHAPAWGATNGAHHRAARAGFQFTLPRGERPPRPPPLPLRARFNSRSRVGSDSKHVPDWHVDVAVSIHAPAWGATDRLPLDRRPDRVSIHAPAWGATNRRTELYPQFAVSIHAPAWGATGQGAVDGGEPPVSIHAPAWGATSTFQKSPVTHVFQFTLPRGERRTDDDNGVFGYQVSIHAPAWGATWHRERLLRAAPVSIHAPAWGATHPYANNPRDNEFQFTLPRGERRAGAGPLPDVQGFNSRSRVGSDCRAPPSPS